MPYKDLDKAWKPILSRNLQQKVRKAKKKTGITQREYIESAIRDRLAKDGI